MGTTKTKKLELLEWLAAVQDKEIIDELTRWKEEHERISIEQYNKELEEATARIESGEYISHEDVVKESKSWLK